MASVQNQVSSGSDGDMRYATFDEKKRKRMISNRESARRSRMKKQQHVDKLIAEMSQLQSQNKVAMQKINDATDMFVGVASDNNVLRAQLSELTDRLYSLNSVLHIVEEGVPLQSGTKDCGLFIMRYMKEICLDKELKFVSKWLRRGSLSYGVDDLNEIRIEWAKYFMKHETS